MSSVWNYYKKAVDADTNTECATCNFCKKSFRLPKSRTTTNLLEHVRKKHKAEVENLAKEAKMEASDRAKSQPKIETMFKRKISRNTKEHIDKNLVVFLAKASLPLHVTELPSFKEFLQSLNASYAIPSQKTLLKLMRKEVDNIDEENRRLCSDEFRIAITVDAWTSKNASCFMLAITGHSLNKNFSDRVNVVLDCVPLEEESHTSELIEVKISQSLSNISISKESICFMVADGATVMVKAASDLSIPYIHCCAHVINLAVSASLSSSICASALKRVKSIVAKLNKSGKMKKAFKRFLNEDDHPCVIPMNDSPTRWSSTYFMLCDFLNAMPAVEKLITSFDLLPLEDGELRVLKAMRTFLQPYQAMTSQVCFQSSCCSMYIPVGKLLIAKTEENLTAARREALQFGEKLLEKTKEYFAKCFVSQSLRFAALCDPRFAFLETVLTRDEWKETIDRFLASKMHSFTPMESDDDATERSTTPKGTDVWSLLTAQDPTSPPSRSSQMQEEDLQMELQQYTIQLNRGDARPGPDSDPICWWRSHQSQFPLLASSASEYLVAPCTSVDSERLFSTAGIVYGNKRRGRLTAKNARLLLMINANVNKDNSRASKAWTYCEYLRYGCPQESSESHSSSEETYSEDLEEPLVLDDDFYVFDG